MRLCVPNFARDIIPVNVGFLKKHVQTSFVLGQRVSSDSVKVIS